jgi:hypothetical protein
LSDGDILRISARRCAVNNGHEFTNGCTCVI